MEDIFGTDEADEILTALALEDDAPIMFESGTIVSNIFTLFIFDQNADSRLLHLCSGRFSNIV